MKITVDYRMAGSSGIGTYITEMLPYLISIAKENGDSILLLGTADRLADFESMPHVDCAVCDIEPFSIRDLLFFPAGLLKRINDGDVYYTPYCNIPAGINVPVFSTIHDVVFLDVPGLASRAGTFIRKCFYRYAVQKSAAIFTVSEFSKERIQKTLRCKKPVAVTYNGIASYLKTPPDPLPAKTDTILFVGNIKKHKGLGILIPAFLEAGEHGLDAVLLIVGNADNFRTGDSDVPELIRNGGDRIKFTGKVSNEQLQQLYAQARLLVQPSLYEGFGIPPLEALFTGTPVLISDIPVFKEIYADLPVTWFKCGDVHDLSKRLLERYNVPVNMKIPEKYSYGNVALCVYTVIKGSMNA